MKKNKAIIFDFDGVIADTMEFHQKCFKKYLNISLSVEEYQTLQRGNVFDGKNLNGKAKIISENLIDYFKKIVKDHFEVKSFAGINDLLRKLNENYYLFIITSSSDVNIINFLKQEKTFDLFTEILGVEAGKLKTKKFEYILKKYNFNKEDILFITDTSGDVFEANKIGLKSIGATWGFHPKEILAESSPEFYVDKPEEILGIVNGYFGL